MSPLIKTHDIDVADGATISPWTGSQYEYLPFDALVEIAILADTGDDFVANVFSGSDVLMEGGIIDAVALTVPFAYPEDYSLSDVAAGGERLGCRLTNVSGAVADVRTAARITPL